MVDGAWTFGLFEEPNPKMAVAAAAVLPPVDTMCCGGCVATFDANSK